MRFAFILAALMAGLVGAQDYWSVQIAAYKDYRQASSQVAELRALGFDAYSEFVMQEGQQYSRVRIGCFSDRDAAASYANDLAGRVTAEAVAQPLSSGSTPRVCVRWDVGFLKPQEWRIVRTEPDIVFRVELARQVGYLQHEGSRWRLVQELPEEPIVASSEAVGFREVGIGGISFAQAQLADGTRVNSCGGRLLWQHHLIAVVERVGAVIACVVDDNSPGGSR